MQTVDYEVNPDSPRTHLFRVACTVAEPDEGGQQFTLPAWIPGSYLIRDFARHVSAVTAVSAYGPVVVTKSDKQTWYCEPCTGPLTIYYHVYARDESVRAAYLDQRRGFFNGTSVFMRVVGCEAMPCRVRITAPVANLDWRVGTVLQAEAVDSVGFGDYTAPDYFALVDQPVAMAAALDMVEFDVAGVPHAMALIGQHDADRDRLAADLQQICETHVRMYGALPLQRYLFLAHVAPSGYGGLEHRECSVLTVARKALPQTTSQPKARAEPYQQMLGLCSHEYFHLWNVKRIRPKAVASNDLTEPAYFRDLWAYEGVTSYYDDLGLVRAGVLPWQTYLDRLANIATRIERTPGRHHQTLAESSFDAWTKFYQPTENTPNAVVSYYGKGALVSLALDLTLRVETDGAVSLDDVMRTVWQRYGVLDEPVPEHGLEALAAETSGLDLSNFFARYVHGTDKLPLDSLLPLFGVQCELVTEDDEQAILRAQGVHLAANNEQARLQYVLAGSAAEQAGLCPQDVVIAVDGVRVAQATLADRLSRSVHGEQVLLHVFRGDELLEFSLHPCAPVADRWRLRLDPKADASARMHCAAWLSDATALTTALS